MNNPSTNVPPTIRPAHLEDAPALAPLSTQLGYPATADEIASRLTLILPDPGQLVAVAETSGQIVGWIHAARYLTLESGEVVEIRGLVVDENRRGAGFGRALLFHAEAWAREQGVRVVRLRSNVVRTATRGFYEHLGYKVVKTQHAFRKHLD